MKPVLPLLACALLASAVAPRCHAVDAVHPTARATTSSRIEQAFLRGDDAALTDIAAHLGAETGLPSQYADYYLGYANYALARLCMSTDVARADHHIASAKAALQRALQANASSAEAHALLASVYGLEIGLHPFHGMWLGRRVGEQLDLAEKLAPHDPRVILARAISDYRAPAGFGGNKQRALKEFGEAIVAFRNFRPVGPRAPTWGKAEAYALRARAEASAGDVMAARRDYRMALALAPDYVDAKAGLARLPAVDPPNH